MRRPTALPPELRAGPFTAAAARAVGVSPERLRRGDLGAPFRGVRTSGTPSFEQHCLAAAERMSSVQFFCNVTAAQLLGLRLPLGLLTRGVHIGTPSRAPRAVGVHGHQLPVGTPLSVTSQGLRVSCAVDTWCQLAAGLSLDGIIAMGDGLVERQDPVATVADLTAAVAGWKNRPGAPKLRAAVLEIRARTDSARETRLRLMLMRAGFAEPVVNLAINDRSGAFIGYADLAYPAQKVIFEYDGGHHRTELQYHIDIDRLDRFMEAGWRVIRVNKSLMSRPTDLFAKAREALSPVISRQSPSV